MAAKPVANERLRGDVELVVLTVLSADKLYGYAISKQVAGLTAGMIDLKPGTLYPLLHRLEADHLIHAVWDSTTGRQRKWYELTPAGRRRLAKQAKEWTQYADCLQRLLAPVLCATAQSRATT